MIGLHDAPAVVCRLCGDALHRVAIPEDEWGWADETGSIYGMDRSLRHLAPDPYTYLEGLAERCRGGVPDAVAAEYHMLKVRLEVKGGTHHIHTPETVPAYVGDVPEHCGWPAMLRPSGWQCRQCGQQLAEVAAA